MEDLFFFPFFPAYLLDSKNPVLRALGTYITTRINRKGSFALFLFKRRINAVEIFGTSHLFSRLSPMCVEHEGNQGEGEQWKKEGCRQVGRQKGKGQGVNLPPCTGV